jgi:very-short-patch-repair endonuclease
MWRDLVERAEILKRNPVVRHLLDTPTQGYGDGSPFPEPARLDSDYSPDAIFAPLSADSSQLSAVLAAAGGKDFVLFGPPGTGKSQTIGNMIAQCLAIGRSVLFVSQKTAALEVVQRRLQEIGLGGYCLEIHSTKAQKSNVLAQLKSAWHERQAASSTGWAGATSDLGALKDELNALVAALHRRRANGLSAYEAFGRVVAGEAAGIVFALDWQEDKASSPEALARLRSLCRDLRPVLEAVGGIPQHLLAGIEAVDWSPRWQTEMVGVLDRHILALQALGEASRGFAAVMGLEPLAGRYAGAAALLALGRHLIRDKAAHGLPFLGSEAETLKAALAEREAFRQEQQRREAGLTGRYRPAVHDLDLQAVLASWLEAQTANFLTRGGKTRRVRLQLGLYAEGELPEDLGPDLAALISVGRHLRTGCAADAILARFGKPWTDPDDAVACLLAATEWARQARQLAALFGELLPDGTQIEAGFAKLLAAIGPLAKGSDGRQAFERFASAWEAAGESKKALNRLARPEEASASVSAEPGGIDDAIVTAKRWQAGLGKARNWCAWQFDRRRAQEAGLAPLLAAIEAGRISPDQIEPAFDTAYARWWSDRIVSDDPVLRRFLPERHEDVIARFRTLDAQVTELAKTVVRSRLGSGIPGPTSFGADPEWGTLASQLVKKTNHMPLRQLFARMPTALARLTPCVMMSPLSIAQYLPPEKEPFDIVIFDEASQIAPWDAIGAIARARQVVVVGDPEQLPPTSVGDRGVDDIEDGSDVTDQESILDECLAANIPRRALDWHYRSRHESLIAFSNAHYYGGRLVTFPSPVTTDRAVRLVRVADGLYERGSSNRVNRPEAQAVVAEVVRRLQEPDFAVARRSLGIVTFNADQQRLIENLLEEQRSAYPDLETFFDKERWHEPVFVKNLENVQGDERDVIIFSVAVGPDAAGRISTTVSSLNKEGGHRRLNVAITRARLELVVFASLRPEQIDLGRTGSRGVRDFKHFLEFADRGVRALAEAAAPTGKDVESPFEQAVRDALAMRGWKVHPQVGVSGFRIDLGIVHPDEPGRYLAGIECDGATYHRSATARDRDRLREMVLTGLGWRIHRVWSTEWWSGASAAADKLDAVLQRELTADRQRITASEETKRQLEADRSEPETVTAPTVSSAAEEVMEMAEPEPQWPANDQAAEPVSEASPRLYAERVEAAPQWTEALLPVDEAPVYRLGDPAQCGHVLQPDLFYDPAYRPVLAAVVAQVLAAEAPVYGDLLVRRIARAHGFARTGSRITQAVAAVIGTEHARTQEEERVILWPAGMTASAIIPYRTAPTSTRSHADVPIAELAGLVRSLAARGPGQDVVRRLAAELGLARLEAGTRSRLERAVIAAETTTGGTEMVT